MKLKILVTVLSVVAQVGIFGAWWWTHDKVNTDYIAFYSAARLWSEGRDAYDLQSQCQFQMPLQGDSCMPFPHPPVLLPVTAFLSNNDYVSSYWRWGLFLLFLQALCILPLYLLSRNISTALQSVLFFPLIGGLILGQDTAFILLATLVWAWLLLKGRDSWAGLVLSLTVVKPHLAILLGVPLLFVRPKAFVWFCLGGLILTAYSLLLVGPSGFKSLVHLTSVLSTSNGYGTERWQMFNATGILVRAGLSASWAWPLFAMGVGLISLLWRRFGISMPSLSLGIIIAVFTSPHLHRHDLSLLLLPLGYIHPLAPAVASFLSMSGLQFGIEQNVIYGLMLTLAFFLLKELRSKTSVPSSNAITPVSAVQ